MTEISYHIIESNGHARSFLKYFRRLVWKMLIIDGNSVYEIDEECAKRKGISKQCGISESLLAEIKEENRQDKKMRNKTSYRREE